MAWNSFVDRAFPVIEGAQRRILGPEAARDGTQRVFEMLIRDDYRLLRDFRGESELSLLAYVRQIARNEAMNELRKRKESAIDPQVLADVLPEQQTENSLESEELRSSLIEVAEKLDLKYREVMLLRIDGYSHREMAEILKLPLNTVLTRMKRAKDQMRGLLPQNFLQ